MKGSSPQKDIITIDRQDVDSLQSRGGLAMEETIPLANWTGDHETAFPMHSWFTRSLLCGEIIPYLQTTMLGCIFLLRLPWVVGYCGIYVAFVIIVISMIAITLTALSLGAIGTDGKFSRFSTFYALLDKNLGRELASSICLVFFFGRTLAASMFCLAFAEVLLWSETGYLDFSPSNWQYAIVALVACLVVFSIGVFSRKIFVTISGILSLVVVAVCYIFVILGFVYNFSSASRINRQGITESDQANTGYSFTGHWGFFNLLGIVFPNFIGVFANLIRAGKLPKRQLPRPVGIITGGAITSLVAIILICLFGVLIDRAQLINRPLMTVILAWPSMHFTQFGIIYAAGWAALYNIISSIRILQVVVRNNAFPLLSSLNTIPGRPNSLSRGFNFSALRTNQAAHLNNFDLESTPTTGISTISRVNDIEARSCGNEVPAPIDDSAAGVPATSMSGFECVKSRLNRFVACLRDADYPNASIGSGEGYTLADTSTIVTVLVVVLIPCLAGNLNYLAPIVSIINLLVFMAINIICFMLALMKGSVFRPRWGHDSWWSSLLGSIWCMLLSLLISWWITVIVLAVFCGFVVYGFHSKSNSEAADWGDALYGIVFQVARNLLLRLNEIHPRDTRVLDVTSGLQSTVRLPTAALEPTSLAESPSNSSKPLDISASLQQYVPEWRPKILVLVRTSDMNTMIHGTASSSVNIYSNSSNNSELREGCQLKLESANLIRLAGQLMTDRGLTMVAAFMKGEVNSFDFRLASLAQEHIAEFMKIEGIRGFPHVSVAPNVDDATQIAIQTFGLGPLSPNTVMADWPNDWDSLSLDAATSHVDKYKAVIAAKKALIVVKGATRLPKNESDLRKSECIDVWWILHDGGLLMLLPHLLSLHKVWKRCRIRLFVVMTNAAENPMKLKRRAEEYLETVGITAVVETVDLTATEEHCTSVYEQTLDIKSRLRLLRGVEALRGATNSTMTVAIRSSRFGNEDSETETKVGGRTSDLISQPKSRPHLTSLFGDEESVGSHVAATNSASNARSKLSSLFSDGNDEKLEFPTTTKSVKMRIDESARNIGKLSSPPTSMEKRKQPGINSSVKINTRISATALQDSSIPVRGSDIISQENKDLGLVEAALQLSHRFGVDPGRLQVALSFNALLRKHSKDAVLVVTNLPLLRKSKVMDFMSYIATLSDGIEPILFVRGSGQEVITTYS